jgi:hypothetical protein
LRAAARLPGLTRAAFADLPVALTRPYGNHEVCDDRFVTLREMVSARKLLSRWRIRWCLDNPKRLRRHMNLLDRSMLMPATSQARAGSPTDVLVRLWRLL